MEDDSVEEKDSVTKATLAQSINKAVQLPSAQKASEIVESIVFEIRNTLVKKETVKISGFGKFTANEKKARKGRNPKTGESIMIADRCVIKFRISDTLRDEINRIADESLS